MNKRWAARRGLRALPCPALLGTGGDVESVKGFDELLGLGGGQGGGVADVGGLAEIDDILGDVLGVVGNALEALDDDGHPQGAADIVWVLGHEREEVGLE